jgi:hypothetical protein
VQAPNRKSETIIQVWDILFIVDVLRVLRDEAEFEVIQVLGEDSADAAIHPGIDASDAGAFLIGTPEGVVGTCILGRQFQATFGGLATLIRADLTGLAVAVDGAVSTAAEAIAIGVAVDAVLLDALQPSRAVTVGQAVAAGDRADTRLAGAFGAAIFTVLAVLMLGTAKSEGAHFACGAVAIVDARRPRGDTHLLPTGEAGIALVISVANRGVAVAHGVGVGALLVVSAGD